MKKVIEDLAAKANLETAYSGSIRIMYIKGERNKDFIAHVHEQYPNLAFELKAVDTFEKPKEEPLSEKFVESIKSILDPTEYANKYEEGYEQKNTPLTDHEEPIEAEESAEEKKLRIRAELDIYLIENPIDKSKKGFFVPIAKKFDVTSDYVRKRYNSLKERNLIKENA